MSAAPSIGDKATKLFALLMATATVAGVTGLGYNVYFNTGRHRKPIPLRTDGGEMTSAETDSSDVDAMQSQKSG